MALRMAAVSFDCDDVGKVGAFWSAVLDRPLDDGASEWFASIGAGDSDRTIFMFHKVPEPKVAKNRCHVDLMAEDRGKEAERLQELGATYVADHSFAGFSWVVLLDPEGNEFCVADVPH